jgi:uncharacterized membrane protein YiaA
MSERNELNAVGGPAATASEPAADWTRVLGGLAVVAGLLITLIGLATDSTPAKGYLFATLLLVTGLTLRLESAIRSLRKA